MVVTTPTEGGTVFVQYYDDDQLVWEASWQTESEYRDSPMGTKEEALKWAQEQGADAILLYSVEANGYIDYPLA